MSIARIRRARLLWMVLRELEDGKMGIFGEPQVPKAIAEIRRKVAERDAKGADVMAGAYDDYDARVTAAERQLVGDLDGHALDVEAALAELSNRGEQVTAASGEPGKAASEVKAADGTQATTQGSNAQVTL